MVKKEYTCVNMGDVAKYDVIFFYSIGGIICFVTIYVFVIFIRVCIYEQRHRILYIENKATRCLNRSQVHTNLLEKV